MFYSLLTLTKINIIILTVRQVLLHCTNGSMFGRPEQWNPIKLHAVVNKTGYLLCFAIHACPHHIHTINKVCDKRGAQRLIIIINARNVHKGSKSIGSAALDMRSMSALSPCKLSFFKMAGRFEYNCEAGFDHRILRN